MKSKFGLNLESLMRKRNLTVRSLSKALDVPLKTAQEWAGPTGRLPRNPEALKKLANHFSVSIHYLLFGEDDPQSLLSEVLEKTELHSGLYEIVIRKVKQK